MNRPHPGLLQTGCCSNCTNRQRYRHFARLNNHCSWKIWDMKHLCPMTQKTGQLPAIQIKRNTNKKRSSSEEQKSNFNVRSLRFVSSKFHDLKSLELQIFAMILLTSSFISNLLYYRYWCHAVAQLVEKLRYKPEGRGFDSRLCHWNSSLT